MKQKDIKWEFGEKMESMTDAQLRKRIKEVMNLEMDNKIRPIPYVGEKNILVKYNTEELVARCPVTGILDLYGLDVEFIPQKLLPELKTLKFYYLGYDQLPISHEHLLAKIFKDFQNVIKPQYLKMTLHVAIRGGITTTISYEE